jgi:hypothetical protein
MRIKYRLANDEDIESMAAFWSQNSDWDIIDRSEWEKRFVHAPFGKATVALGIDEETNEIISQFVFIPVAITVNGTEMRAFRPFAPILRKSFQTKFGIASLLTGTHPLLKMYKIVQDQLTKEKTTLIYMIPDPRWSRVLQAFPFVLTHRFPLYTRLVTSNEVNKFSTSIDILPIHSFDADIDDLWEKSSIVYSCSIIRNSKSLPFKTSHGNFKVYIVKHNNRAIGLFVFVYKQKDKQWLICDLLSIDKNESLATTLEAACFTIQQEVKAVEAADNFPGKIAILATPAIEAIVTRQGFDKNDYHFTLAVHILNKDGLDKKNIAPENWYVSAND